MAKKNSQKPIGKIDMPRLFQAEALSLLEAVERGGLLHGTKNIRDSGGPLETRVRELLETRMPEGIQVRTGYLYGVNSACSPQIDVMLLSARDNHMMMTVDDGCIYAPFTSALAAIEVKSATGNLSQQLDQLQAIKKSVQDMTGELRTRRAQGGSLLPRFFSVLLFATSRDLKIAHLRKWFDSHVDNLPAYVVLLDRACIVTPESRLNDMLAMSDAPSVGFDDHSNNPGEVCLCGPATRDELAQGRVLLWLYFALLNAANQFGGNLGPASDFVREAAHRYALNKVVRLRDAKTWPDRFNAVAR